MPAPRSGRCRGGSPTGLAVLLAALFAAFAAGGCDNSIEPFSEKGSYAVHGFLDPTRETQFVRVKPLSVPVSKTDPGPLEATVRLVTVDAGTSEVLADSIIAFTDADTEVYTHNFWTDAPIAPKTTYQLTVEGPAGRVKARTTTPTGMDPKITPQFGACGASFRVVFREMKDPRLVRASWEMHLTELPRMHRRGEWAYFPFHGSAETDAGDQTATFRPETTLINLYTETDFLPQPPALPDSLNEECWSSNWCAILGSDQVRVRYTYLGPEWYGDVPEDSLTYDPLESRDVKGGMGFFGAARRGIDSTTVDTDPIIWTGGRRCARAPPDSIAGGSSRAARAAPDHGRD